MIYSAQFKTAFLHGILATHNGNPNTILIYKGTNKPTSLYSVNFNAATYSADLLLTFSLVNSSWNVSNGVISLFGSPAPASATGTGTATWGACYNNASMPNCFLGDVSVNGGNGIFIMPVTSIVAGSSYVLSDITFTL